MAYEPIPLEEIDGVLIGDQWADIVPGSFMTEVSRLGGTDGWALADLVSFRLADGSRTVNARAAAVGGVRRRPSGFG